MWGLQAGSDPSGLPTQVKDSEMKKKKMILHKGDHLVGPGALIEVLHVERDIITIQNSITHDIRKVPLRSLDHLEVKRN